VRAFLDVRFVARERELKLQKPRILLAITLILIQGNGLIGLHDFRNHKTSFLLDVA
jgi:hypothetical protein